MATVSSLVLAPRITSTSGILRTGLKKWMPQNRSGCSSFSASFVIGIVDVFEARMAVGLSLRFQTREDLPLHIGVLDHRFDDQIGTGQLCIGIGGV